MRDYIPEFRLIDSVVTERVTVRLEYIKENVAISALLENAIADIGECIAANLWANAVVQTGVPGFMPQTE